MDLNLQISNADLQRVPQAFRARSVESDWIGAAELGGTFHAKEGRSRQSNDLIFHDVPLYLLS